LAFLLSSAFFSIPFFLLLFVRILKSYWGSTEPGIIGAEQQAVVNFSIHRLLEGCITWLAMDWILTLPDWNFFSCRFFSSFPPLPLFSLFSPTTF